MYSNDSYEVSKEGERVVYGRRKTVWWMLDQINNAGSAERSSSLPRIKVPAAFLVGFRRALHITHLNERNSDHHIYQRFCQSISSIIEMYLSEIRGHFPILRIKEVGVFNQVKRIVFTAREM